MALAAILASHNAKGFFTIVTDTTGLALCHISHGVGPLVGKVVDGIMTGGTVAISGHMAVMVKSCIWYILYRISDGFCI